MKPCRFHFGALAILLVMAGPALAQPRVITTTRLVAQYSDLEQRLDRAIQARDAAAINALVSSDFEQWTPAPPGDPIPREDWMRSVMTSFSLKSFRIRQMAVRTIGDTAVVSFVEDRQAVCAGRDCSGSRFIVDLWRPHDGGAQLLVRYDSEKLAQPSPAAPPKPTGKE